MTLYHPGTVLERSLTIGANERSIHQLFQLAISGIAQMVWMWQFSLMACASLVSRSNNDAQTYVYAPCFAVVLRGTA